MRGRHHGGRLVHTTRLIAVGSVALLATAACTGSDPSANDRGDSTGASTTTPLGSVDAADTEPTSPATVVPAPLTALLDRVSADPATAELQRARVDELTAQCMHDLGWEYWVGQSDPSDPRLNPQPNDSTGYGVVDAYETYTLPEMQGAPPPATPVDKNIEYVQSLSPEEALRYNEDRSGDTAPGDPDGATAYEQSCMYRAQAEAGTLPVFESIEGLEDRIRELLTMIDTDPGVTAALDTFDDCVDEAFGPREVLGHSVAADPYLYLLILLNQAMGLDVVDDAEATAASPSPYAFPDGTRVSFAGTRHEIGDDALARLRDTELRLYRANNDCTASSGVEAARNAVEARIAEQLLQEFPDLAVAVDG